MSLEAFSCLSNAILLIVLFIYSTKYISSKSYKNYLLQISIKKNLEKIYMMNSYKDSVHN